MNTAPLIRLAQIDYRRNGRTILQGVDLDIQAGEIVTLIGPNGAGKSTLVAIALKLLQPDRGVIERRRGLRIGYVPQKIEIDPAMPLSVQRFLQLEHRHPRKLISRALLHAGAPLEHLPDTPMQLISGGEMRRVLLARALLREPDLLILDEPSAGMDLSGQAELYRLIQNLRERRRCGVLLVSHDLNMVMAATDRVFCINRHLCCSGRPENVRRHPEFLAMFGARAASGLAVYQHHHDHKHDLHGDIKTTPDNAQKNNAEATAHSSNKIFRNTGDDATSHPADNDATAHPRRRQHSDG